MLELNNITWSVPGEQEVLRGVTLTIPEHRVVVITGPNGSGKTTLAKMIAGVKQPDSGAILLDGEDITHLSVTDRAKKGVAFAFQQPVRFKGITVRDLLSLAAGKSADGGRLSAALTKVGLEPEKYLDREVDAHLSGGEIKRVEIATVLLRGAKYTIFDEPEAGIDIWSFGSLIETFEALKAETSASLVIISHQERILSIADDIVLIENGRIKAQGPRCTLYPQLFREGDCQRCNHGKEERHE